MRLARNISAGAASRRALLADLLVALVLASLAIVLAAGIGVVGFFALLVLLALSIWVAVEAGTRFLLRRAHHTRPSKE